MIIHKCDICQKEIKNVIMANMPVNEYGHMTDEEYLLKIKEKPYPVLSNVDLCPSCAAQLADFLDSIAISPLQLRQ